MLAENHRQMDNIGLALLAERHFGIYWSIALRKFPHVTRPLILVEELHLRFMAA